MPTLYTINPIPWAAGDVIEDASNCLTTVSYIRYFDFARLCSNDSNLPLEIILMIFKHVNIYEKLHPRVSQYFFHNTGRPVFLTLRHIGMKFEIANGVKYSVQYTTNYVNLFYHFSITRSMYQRGNITIDREYIEESFGLRFPTNMLNSRKKRRFARLIKRIDYSDIFVLYAEHIFTNMYNSLNFDTYTHVSSLRWEVLQRMRSGLRSGAIREKLDQDIKI
jgi:hypothetical protein